MHKKRIIFFGTDGQELTSSHLAEFIKNDANIVGYVQAPQGSISTTHKEKDPYDGINKVADNSGIPIFCPKNPNDEELYNNLRKLKPDIFIVVGYQFYISDKLLSLPPLGAINFHSSLLPRHAGMHPGFWAIWYGDKESGMVIHYMDSGIDTGDIVYEIRVPVKSGDTIDSLYHRIWKSSLSVVKNLLDDIEKEEIPRRPQDMDKYIYNYEIIDEDFNLDFRQPAEILYNRVMMSPGRFYFKYSNKKYFVESCTILKEFVDTRKFFINTPYKFGKKIFFVTPRNFLQINTVIEEGKKVDPFPIFKDIK